MCVLCIFFSSFHIRKHKLFQNNNNKLSINYYNKNNVKFTRNEFLLKEVYESFLA